ncbi:unnamed protein product [Vitrella brassicaformis CCMP3155]|uniref:Uncharacterized protein n=1 Tax=Vitrella brassicaformis (strain CCMP3155) TaxID=1169540 RepID=A0A0G4FVH3_VITBC|nr:unnamed protein product [Vitrella brassicaformis CCMP3155]|eukprot:CEM19218.1 unnamed protein product [Vitrella brassicaformis CCMP3155]
MSGAEMSDVKDLAVKAGRDISGAWVSAIAYMGDQLGLFRKLAEAPNNGEGRGVTSAELSKSLQLNERYVREWLHAMVAAEYIECELVDSYVDRGEGTQEGKRKFFMTGAQRAVFAADESPFAMNGYFEFTLGSFRSIPEVMRCFRDGGGVPFSALGPDVSHGIHRMHVPLFVHQMPSWFANHPSLHDKMTRGIRFLDIGVGSGLSTIELARRYPRTTFVGLDPDAVSIERARKAAPPHLTNLDFVQSTIEGLPSHPQQVFFHGRHSFDAAFCFDVVHDLKDPVAALSTIRSLLKPDGELLWSEPAGSVDPVENRSTKRRTRQALSILHCMTVSMAEGGEGLGTLIGKERAERLAREASFSTFQLVHDISSEDGQYFYRLLP